jgi:hypothetical protein
VGLDMLELERLPLLAASSGGMTEVSYRPTGVIASPNNKRAGTAGF